MDAIDWNWDSMDVLKAVFSLTLGLILGLEREMKDKAAGLRTITVISLGSTLFTILSYKIGLHTGTETTRIASYIVSGIGFLGAGVIFKDGVSINGLTTASIIWVAAAIGMSIGFGQFATAITFFGATLVTIHLGNWLNQKLLSQMLHRTLEIKFSKVSVNQEQLMDEISSIAQHAYIKQQIKEQDTLHLLIELKIKAKHQTELLHYLTTHPEIAYYKI